MLNVCTEKTRLTLEDVCDESLNFSMYFLLRSLSELKLRPNKIFGNFRLTGVFVKAKIKRDRTIVLRKGWLFNAGISVLKIRIG